MRFQDLTPRDRDLVVSARWSCDRRAPYFAPITFAWQFEPRDGGQVRYREGWTLEFPRHLSPGELATLMIVAADSVERDHPGRRGERDPEIFNIACWLESVSAWRAVLERDDTRFHMPELAWPDGSQFPEDLGLLPNLRAEEYYAALRELMDSRSPEAGTGDGADPAGMPGPVDDDGQERSADDVAPPQPSPQDELDQQVAAPPGDPGEGVPESQDGPDHDVPGGTLPAPRDRQPGAPGQDGPGSGAQPTPGEGSNTGPGAPTHTAGRSSTPPSGGGSGPGGSGTHLHEPPMDFSGSAPPGDLPAMERVGRQVTDGLQEFVQNSSPGDVPGHLAVRLEPRGGSRYPWVAVMERHFDEVSSTNDFGLAPRLSPYSAIYERPIETSQRHLPDIVLIGDVSGSMSGRREEVMRAHMDRIRRQANVILEAFGDVELKLVSRRRVTETSGHGGTDMDAVLREVERLHHPEAIVLFTDGELPHWPQRPANNVIFAIVNEGPIDVPEHIKRVVRIPWEPAVAGPQLPPR